MCACGGASVMVLCAFVRVVVLRRLAPYCCCISVANVYNGPQRDTADSTQCKRLLRRPSSKVRKSTAPHMGVAQHGHVEMKTEVNMPTRTPDQRVGSQPARSCARKHGTAGRACAYTGGTPPHGRRAPCVGTPPGLRRLNNGRAEGEIFHTTL